MTHHFLIILLYFLIIYAIGVIDAYYFYTGNDVILIVCSLPALCSVTSHCYHDIGYEGRFYTMEIGNHYTERFQFLFCGLLRLKKLTMRKVNKAEKT